MPIDSRGAPVYDISSNRSPWYSDATTDGTGVLGVNGVKTIQIKDAAGNPAVASEIIMINGSNSLATVQIVTAVSRAEVEAQQTYESGGGVLPVAHVGAVDTQAQGIRVAPGESYTLKVRATRIIESNTGGAAQTGSGMRYIAVLEPSRP